MRLPRGPKRPPPRPLIAQGPPKRAAFQPVSDPTLLGLQDQVTSAQDLTQPGRGQSASARAARTGWATDDIVPALAGRVTELEAQVARVQADLAAERSRLATYAESDRSPDAIAADGYRSGDAILERARAEADRVLRSVVDERRRLLSEIERLREEREELHDEIASLHGGRIVEALESTPTPAAADLEVAIANEMRELLVEILADFRSPVAPSPAVEITTVEPATPAEIVSVPAEEIRESIVEHVDKLPVSEGA